MMMVTKGAMQKTTSAVPVVAMLMMMTVTRTAWGHGMMIDPPQRSSMWRYGFPKAPKNYNDNQLFCGGFSTQWSLNGGKCGICGDAFNAEEPRPNEAGGEFATGVIVKTYEQGEVIDVAVKITANHLGYFLFKLCPNNDVRKEATQECLDEHVLRVVGPNGQDLGEKYYTDPLVSTKHLRLKLPNDVTCTQCVLQWTYNTGNSWGCNKDDFIDDGDDEDLCCLGCGPQEQFVNCADIAITGSDNHPPAPTTTEEPKKTEAPDTPAPTTAAPEPTPTPSTTTPPPTTSTTTTTTKKPAETVAPPRTGSGCKATGLYITVPGLDAWCEANCARNNCPPSHCLCS